MKPTLCIDIGNTSATIGVYRSGRVSKVHRAPSAEPAVDLETLPARAVIASVKPPVNDAWEQLLFKTGVEEIIWVDHKINLGIPVTYPNPKTIGADRLVNACAAARLYGTPAVVCDFGTALTFDIVAPEAGYVGGIICPGLPLMFDYLAEKTELLPHIKPSKTTAVVGKNTKQAMRIGARLGYRGMVRETLTAIQRDLGVSEMHVVATGGFADWVFKDWDLQVPVNKNLTLLGLGLISELNR
ncbi:type III pantothenate kinase [Verrucomicrobiota bacterium]